MTSIYWLASYPKSGNTWIRILLTNYLNNSEQPSDINDLEGGPIASARIWFDEWVGVEASALDDKLIAKLRPEVYRCMCCEETKPIFMKVHDAWSQETDTEGLFPADVTAGVVYIMRNPLDIAASSANHSGIDIVKAVGNLCNPDFTLARSFGGLSDQLQQRLGAWSSHVTSWLDDSNLNMICIRYEDLRRDPHKYFGEVVRFCGLEYYADRLEKAVAFSDFRELQRQEKEKGFKERSIVAPEAFFRKGQSGGWRHELSIDLVKRIIDVNGETMRRFGYLDENYQPV